MCVYYNISINNTKQDVNTFMSFERGLILEIKTKGKVGTQKFG